MANGDGLPFLKLCIVSAPDPEQDLGNWIESQGEGFHHRSRVGEFSFIEIDFVALKDLHVVLLEKVRFENLQVLKVTLEIKAFAPDFVFIGSHVFELDFNVLLIGKARRIVMELLINLA